MALSKPHFWKKNKKSNNKFSEIAEILGMLESSNKGRDWVVREIKRHKINTSTKSTMNSFEILKACNAAFITHLLNVLKNGDVEDIGDIKTLTRTYHWFFTDIVGSANPAILTKDQARKVWALNELIGRTDTFSQRNPTEDVMSITGDGMVIGFNDSPEKPIRLAIELHKLIAKYNQSKKSKDRLTIRVGVDSGPVYFIRDLTGKDNFWGPGIIMARRVMDLARPMQILASARIAIDVKKLSSENKSALHYLGDYKIKHGEKIEIFNVYGDGYGNKLAPVGKVEDKKPEDVSNVSTFYFPKIELKLDIKNTQTMMCHHTWLWNIVNITDAPLDKVSYYLEGDTSKDFSELNVTVRDENNHKAKIVSLNSNKPYAKEFIVKLNKPLKPNQKRRFLRLEYDWEEPERNFVYTLSTDCKIFKYLLTVPKGLEIKQRVLKVDPATRHKSYASSEPHVKYHKTKTEVIWTASNLHSYEAYRFEW
jgi:class 3 adenylate cyclase